jgi:hypothetical protein
MALLLSSPSTTFGPRHQKRMQYSPKLESPGQTPWLGCCRPRHTFGAASGPGSCCLAKVVRLHTQHEGKNLASMSQVLNTSFPYGSIVHQHTVSPGLFDVPIVRNALIQPSSGNITHIPAQDKTTHERNPSNRKLLPVPIHIHNTYH